jgi:hypothetical protein
MSEMLLLGAGASVEAGVPGAYAMSTEIVKRLRDKPQFRREAHLLSFIAGGLLQKAGRDNSNPFTAGVNVEDLFNAVSLLGERETLEAAPFVASWDPMLEEFDKIPPSSPDTRNVLRAIYDVVAGRVASAFDEGPPSFTANEIDRALQETIRASSGYSFSRLGSRIERFMKEMAQKWKSRLTSGAPSNSWELDRQIAQLFQE